MMYRPVYAALVATLVAFPAAAQSEPTNYDECILETMKGVSSDVAARAIIESCRSLFPDTPDEEPASAAAPGAAAASGAAAAAATTPEAAAPASASPAPDTVAPVSTSEAASAREPAAPASQPAPAQAASGSVRELSSDELDKIEYRGNFFGTTYRVKVYNGNESLRLTELTIAVWDKNYIDGLETYRSAVDINPLEEGTAKYTVVYEGEEDTWAWKLVGAKGAE